MHAIAKCVWPKQNNPQFAKTFVKKSKLNHFGLVRVLDGVVSAEYLEKDFVFHFPWGRCNTPKPYF